MDVNALRVVGKPRYRKITSGRTKFIPTGIPFLGDTLNDLETGTVTIFGGCPGDGKSTIVHRIALEAIDHGFKAMVVDGEHRQEILINNLYTKIVGYDKENYTNSRYNKMYIKEPKKHVVEALEKWHKDNLIIYSKHEATEIKTLDELFDMMIYYVQELKVELLVLDNLMSLISGNTEDLLKDQSLFMKRATVLAKKYNVAIVLVTHPNKTVQRGEEFEYYQIAGNSDIVNLADNVVIVWREFDVHKEADGYIAVKKNRQYGKLGKKQLTYISQTSTLAQFENGRAMINKIDFYPKGDQEGWEKTESTPY